MSFKELPNEWKTILGQDITALAENLSARAENERRYGLTVYPEQHNLFSAFHFTKPHDIKCVILGQDPYHGAGQAHGLSFSVQADVKQPPSLQNIFKELNTDTGAPIPSDGNLTRWAKQGVLMLNSALTVEAGKPNSHSNWGWSKLVTRTLQYCDSLNPKVIFILWGKNAMTVAKNAGINIDAPNVIKSAHPSPYSANNGFFGSKPFSRANAMLQNPINW